MTIDKNYFVAPEGNAPRYIRGELSHLTNIVLMIEDGKSEKAEAESFLRELLNDPWYQKVEIDRKPAQVEHDLYLACCYWEEQWRYDRCWPFIRALLEEFLSGEEAAEKGQP